jgi:hypothetical protein
VYLLLELFDDSFVVLANRLDLKRICKVDLKFCKSRDRRRRLFTHLSYLLFIQPTHKQVFVGLLMVGGYFCHFFISSLPFGNLGFSSLGGFLW